MSSPTACKSAGKTNPDIGGLGIILGLLIQGGIAMILSFWSILFKNHEAGKKALRKILTSLCAVQWISGLSLLIAAIAQKDLDLYHQRVIYECFSIVIISASSLLMASREIEDNDNAELTAEESNSRAWYQIFMFMMITPFWTLGLVFFLKFHDSLKNWNYTETGKCYNTVSLAKPRAVHPHADIAYVNVTYIFLNLLTLLNLSSAFYDSREVGKSKRLTRHDTPPNLSYHRQLSRARRQAKEDADDWCRENCCYCCISVLMCLTETKGKLVLWFLSTALYIVQTYMAVRIRALNVNNLDGESENSWGFGQVVAIISLSAVAIEGLKTFGEFIEHEGKETEKAGGGNAIGAPATFAPLKKVVSKQPVKEPEMIPEPQA